MRHLLAFLLLAGYAAMGPGGYDRRELGAVRSVTHGTIEKVHPVPMEDDDGEELVIRLDDGNRVAVVQPGWQGLQAGDRVQVRIGTKASRVERGVVGSELPVSEASR
jgi:outer membrane lipoprotein SlyB